MGNITNCHNQLPQPNRILLVNMGVFQLEKKPYRKLVTVFTRGGYIQSTIYRSVSLHQTLINPCPLLLLGYRPGSYICPPKPCTNFFSILYRIVDQDSVVGIVTWYTLDGQGIEPRWGRDFPHPSIPSLRPNQPTMQCVRGHSSE